MTSICNPKSVTEPNDQPDPTDHLEDIDHFACSHGGAESCGLIQPPMNNSADIEALRLFALNCRPGGQRSRPNAKDFSLKAPGKDDARVRDKIRHEVNKAVLRQKRKPLPEGFVVWEFKCQVGASPTNAGNRSLKEVASAIDAVAQAGASEVYIEIVAVPA